MDTPQKAVVKRTLYLFKPRPKADAAPKAEKPKVQWFKSKPKAQAAPPVQDAPKADAPPPVPPAAS